MICLGTVCILRAVEKTKAKAAKVIKIADVDITVIGVTNYGAEAFENLTRKEQYYYLRGLLNGLKIGHLASKEFVKDYIKTIDTELYNLLTKTNL